MAPYTNFAKQLMATCFAHNRMQLFAARKLHKFIVVNFLNKDYQFSERQNLSGMLIFTTTR